MGKTEIQKLLNVMKRLRDPQKGCPWDKKQTMESIIPYSIEEVYEVAEQVYLKNYEKLFSDVKRGAKKANRVLNEIDVVANVPVMLLENNNDDERKKVKRTLAIRLLLESNTLKDLGWNEQPPIQTSQLKMIINSSTSLCE